MIGKAGIATSATTWRLAAAVVLAGLCAGAGAADGVVGPGNCNEAGLVSVLGAVQAGGGGTITFNCGAAPVTIVFTGYKQISAAVVIDGGNAITIDGNGSSAFFQVFASGDLRLRRLRLRRGVLNDIHPLENIGSLHLDDVSLREGQGSGSALANYGTATVRSSFFVQNAIDSGAVRTGAALLNDGGTLLVVDSDFQDNSVLGSIGNGGAIAAIGGGSITVRRSRFTGNQAPDGGAVYIASGVAARFENSEFIGNGAGYGGAIETWGNATRVEYSRFDGNQALLGDGGAIWAVQGHLVVEDSRFSGNSAATTGGALSCHGEILTITRSAFDSNLSGSHGGAVYGGCGFLVGNSTFHGNTAGGVASGGGALYHTGPLFGGVFFATLTGNAAGFGAGLGSQGSGGSSVNVSGSILAGNAGGNCAGVLTSGGYNLSDDSFCAGSLTGPGDLHQVTMALLPYGDYGGFSPTRPPAAGSPAIDRVPLTDCPVNFALDQRGALRPVNGACDSGAFEVGAVIDAIYFDGFQ